MPLVGLNHSHFWQDQGEPPPTPGRRKRLLLKVGHGFVAMLPLILFLFTGGP